MMVTQKDWLMRQIENICRLIAKLLFNKQSPRYEIVDVSTNTETDLLHKELIGLLNEFKINEAENLLFDRINALNINYLLVAIDFYTRLNEYDDDFLSKNDFSREEIESGLREVQKIFGITLG
jgi:hypothetical protein